MIKIEATRKEAYDLFHRASLALAKVEWNGICVDEEYCHRTRKKLAKEIRKIQADLQDTEIVRVWRRHFGNRFNWDANDQLAFVLFKILKYQPVKFTTHRKPATDEDSLIDLGLPIVDQLVRMRQLKKCRNTFLQSILRESVDGRIHPMFNLDTVVSYRSSSSNPNFHNMPIRLPEMSRIIRSAIRARPRRQILELDYKGLEVNVGACYHKDPTMIEYILDDSKDMHRDMAMQCYILKRDQVNKDVRYCGKNKFVFPEFYGDYFVNCAGALWKAIGRMKLVREPDKVGLKVHLREHGISSLIRFTKHIERVERDFWYRRFRVYTGWKDEHYETYLRRGYFDMLTGFRCSGILRRNQVINYPVQGTAFHCLLWSLIDIMREFQNRRLHSLIVGQIHDSIIIDLVPEEREEVLAICRGTMSKRIREAWKWIIVPLKIEAELAPVDGTWFDKKGIELD